MDRGGWRRGFATAKGRLNKPLIDREAGTFRSMPSRLIWSNGEAEAVAVTEE